MKVVRNTAIHDAIKEAFHAGATSAGAAVMSQGMITGAQKNRKENSDFDKIWFHNSGTEEGLGLLENVNIDQHFIDARFFSRY